MDGKKEKVTKVTPEVAEQDFSRFAEAWEIDDNIEAMNAEDKESFKQQKGRIVTTITKGRASVDDKGDIHFTPKYSGEMDELVFRIPKGTAYLIMDNFKERQGMHKTFSYMGSLTKKHVKVFANMDARDLKPCLGVTLLFLGS